MKALFFCLIVCVNSLFAETKLLVGTTSGFAPYVSLNAKGEYEGFDIDFSQELGKKMGKSIEIKDFGSMPGLMLALEQGKIDVLIWAVQITEVRLKKYEMVHYYGKPFTEMPFIFWKEVPAGITRIEDLAKDPNWVFAVEGGTTQEDLMRMYPQLKLKTMDKITDVVLELRYGKSFAGLIERSVLPKYQEKFPEIKVLPLPMPSSLHVYGLGVCLLKSNKPLVEEVKKAVQALKDEGVIAALEKKWKLEE